MVSDASLAVLKKMFTPEENKPANKGDIQEFKNLINIRYFLVHNINPDSFLNSPPHFDVWTYQIQM
ncbi:hypothetical protein [Lutibacter citreus]|uniref:hypothetical protein n=1 Tax=Lutibacter citreus TaxID=2138210 RepID=UPI0013001C3A|nr:hypothetical protein [Lutibacter citreus]